MSTPVMSPVARSTKTLSPTDPPLFDPTHDLQEWRRNVRRWVETISVAAEKGPDRAYKTVFATLAHHLYDRGLPSAQKSIVDEAQEKGLIDYKQEDQVAALRDIVELIAVDPPIAVVSRLISSFNKVTECRRRKNEDLASFVSRFRGLAADHLMHGGMSSSSQIGEVLAITLLNNSNLSEETLTNAKLQLVTLAHAREEKTIPESVPVPRKNLEKMEAQVAELSSLPDQRHMRTFKSDGVPMLKAKVHKSRAEVSRVAGALEQELAAIESSESKASESIGDRIFRKTPRCRLNLDDAVVVLRNLSFSPSKDVDAVSRNIENIVGQKVQHALMSLSQDGLAKTPVPPGGPNSGRRKRRRRSHPGKEPSGGGPAEVLCFDCGSDKHVRGDDQCDQPSFLTRKLRRKNKFGGQDESSDKRKHDQRRGVHDREVNPDQGFRQGSDPSNRKRV